MARRRFLHSARLAPLVVLWFATGLAAAPSSRESSWHQSRAAVERAQYDLADRLIVQALARSDGAPDRWFWELRVLRGQTLCWTYKPREALEWLRPELPPSLRESTAGIRRLLNLGLAHWMLGDGKSATLFAEARRLAERFPAVQAEVYCWSALIEKDAPRRGEQFARKALEAAQRRGETFFVIFAMNELAWNCARQERYGEAMHWWETLLPLAEQRRLDWSVQKTEGNLGWLYMELGDFEIAAGLFESAQRKAARLETPGDLMKWTNQRGNVALQMRDYAAAEKFCAAAVALASGKPSEQLGHALANLARVAIETNRPDVAQRHNDAALALKKQVKDEPGVQRSFILDAQIASLRGRHDEAIAKLKEIAKAQEASVRWEAQGRLAQVFVRAKRDREAEVQFRNAIDTVREARKSIETAELRFAFFRVAEDVFDAYVDFLVARKRNDDALGVTELIRAATLEEELGLGAPKPLNPRALAAARKATILCYWLGREKSYLWIIDANQVVLRELRRDRDIESAVDAYLRLILNTRVRRDQIQVAGKVLYDMLVAPAASMLPRDARVVIVPDGRMHVLNMESIVVPRPTPHFWIEDVTLVSAGSLQLLARKTRAGAPLRDMLLIGAPRLADAAYPPLPKAALEIENVRRHFPKGLVLDGPKATPAGYRNAAPGGFAYLHFVAHGEATRRKPLDAAVILGKDATGGYKLFAREIVSQPLAARLVTVSTCYGAGTRPFVGEGLVGLAWAFLRAGAQQVVAALWEVSDSTAPALMDAMYTRIRAGQDPATALRQAKLELVRNKHKPFYWAPFVLYGGM